MASGVWSQTWWTAPLVIILSNSFIISATKSYNKQVHFSSFVGIQYGRIISLRRGDVEIC